MSTDALAGTDALARICIEIEIFTDNKNLSIHKIFLQIAFTFH